MIGLMEELRKFRYIPDETVQLFEKVYDEVLDIDSDNWQEAKEAAEKAVLNSKHGDLYVDAMLLYLGKKAREMEQIKALRSYPSI